MSDFTPLLLGLNFTPTLHDEPGSSVRPALQVDDEITKFVPTLNLTELIVAELGLAAELDSVTVPALLERPTLTPP